MTDIQMVDVPRDGATAGSPFTHSRGEWALGPLVVSPPTPFSLRGAPADRLTERPSTDHDIRVIWLATPDTPSKNLKPHSRSGYTQPRSYDHLVELPCRVGRTNITHIQFHKRDTTNSLFTFTNTTDRHYTIMLDEIRTLIRAHEAARSSGRAVTRVSDPNTGVKHHHTPSRASGSGV
eukprot:3402786-Pleurochrysis_carterae.AAC.1